MPIQDWNGDNGCSPPQPLAGFEQGHRAEKLRECLQMRPAGCRVEYRTTRRPKSGKIGKGLGMTGAVDSGPGEVAELDNKLLWPGVPIGTRGPAADISRAYATQRHLDHR